MSTPEEYQQIITNAMDTVQNVLGQAVSVAKDAASAVQGAVSDLSGSGLAASGLPTRQLGKNGPYVTGMGFGTMGLSAFYGKPKPDAERFAVLDAAYNAGELHWDSADM